MAGRLSQVFRAVNQSLNVGGKHQVASVQKRHIGNLPVKPNPYVEDWATHRENVELTFKFDGKTIAILGAAAVTVPYVIYQMCCSEFVSTRMHVLCLCACLCLCVRTNHLGPQEALLSNFWFCFVCCSSLLAIHAGYGRKGTEEVLGKGRTTATEKHELK
jgi:hypothetical protein